MKIHRIGVCGTDIHASTANGRQTPFSPTHASWDTTTRVEVIAVAPDVTGVAPGDRCAVEPYLNCGQCIACRRRQGQLLHEPSSPGRPCRRRSPRAHRHSRRETPPVTPPDAGSTRARRDSRHRAHAVDRAQLEAGETVPRHRSRHRSAWLSFNSPRRRRRGDRLEVNDARLAFCRETLGVTHTVKSVHPKTSPPNSRLSPMAACRPPYSTRLGIKEIMAASFDWAGPWRTAHLRRAFSGRRRFQ